jgi:ubiquinone/menaquinone biosynthesis C-methylase UbiE
MSEYAIGHGEGAVSIMGARRAEDWAAHLLPHLRPGMRLLDCGCGPGSITSGLARRVAPGDVVGIDRGETQVEQARKAAAQAGVENARFEVGDVMSLPFGDGELDVVHAHMVVMHLQDPVGALREMLRVLRPGGLAALRDTVIDGWWVAGPSAVLQAEAFPLVQAATQARGGDWNRGRDLGRLLREAGFARVVQSASYNYSGNGFENGSIGAGFAGMLREMLTPIVETGRADEERVEAIAAAWESLGQGEEDVVASAAGEAVGWKADG